MLVIRLLIECKGCTLLWARWEMWWCNVIMMINKLMSLRSCHAMNMLPKYIMHPDRENYFLHSPICWCVRVTLGQWMGWNFEETESKRLSVRSRKWHLKGMPPNFWSCPFFTILYWQSVDISDYGKKLKKQKLTFKGVI